MAIDGLYVDSTEPFTSAPLVLTALGFAAFPLAVCVQSTLAREHRLGLMLIAATSGVAGIVIMWASANGLRNGPLGLLPAALVGLGALGLLARCGAPEAARRVEVASILLCSLMAFQLAQLWSTAYRDAPPAALEVTIDAGPWMGLRTTPARKHFVEQMASDLRSARADAATILFYDYMPAGYLLSDLRPRTPALWLFPGYCCQGNPRARRVYASGFDGERPLPDLVVRMRCLFGPGEPRRLVEPRGWPPDPPLRERPRRAGAHGSSRAPLGRHPPHRPPRDRRSVPASV